MNSRVQDTFANLHRRVLQNIARRQVSPINASASYAPANGYELAQSQGRIQGGAKGAEAPPPSKLMRCVTYILVKILTLIK